MRVLITLAFLLALAASAHAVEPWENWLSLIWDPFGTAYDNDCMFQEVDETITLTLWLVRPVNPDFDDGQERAVTSVGGFDCAVTASEGLNLLGWTPSAPATVVVQGSALAVTYDEPLPVVGGRAALATCEVYVGNVTGFELPEAPVPRCTNNPNAYTYVRGVPLGAIPGVVSYVDADDPIDPLVAPRTFADGPDLKFQIVWSLVPTDRPAWSGVKALYR